MPRKKFNRDEAAKFWSSYTKNLSDSITETEREGLEKGYSSYEIERLWQKKTNEKYQKRKVLIKEEAGEEKTKEKEK